MTTDVLAVTADPESIGLFSQASLREPELRLSAVVTTGRAAFALLDAQTPDVMLIDLDLADIDGVEVIREAARRHPACRNLAFTTPGDGRRVKAAIEAGASGCLLRDAAPEQIAGAVREMRAGGCPICPRIARQIIEGLQGAASAAPAAAEAESPLTSRESEILRLAAKGLGFGTISELLDISTHTVVTHVKKIYRKLSVHSRGEAVYEARQMGWL